MRTRLLLVLLPLLALLLVALETPLAQSHAERLSQERFLKLVGAIEELAGIADPVLREGSDAQRLKALLRSTERIHDSRLFVVDDVGDVKIPAGRDDPANPGAIARATAAALAGLSPDRPATAWPWRREPFVLAAPLGDGGRPPGAVVAVAPTAGVRREIRDRLLLLAAAGLAVLLLATFVCLLPLARWVLRPVDELTAGVQRITAGEPDSRVPERGGPPELRGLATAFNAMAASVARALERQRAFAADASHQLRNPLTALRLRLDSLALHIAPDGERELRSALDEAQRLSTTIDVLLRLARAEATAAEMTVLDVGRIAAGRVEVWAPAVAAAGAELMLSVTDACHASCDASAIEQALDAVLDNALKFGDGAAVEVSVTRHGDDVRVRVRDHGPGLTAQERSAAAERFWRSARDQNVDGTGLGLTIARTLLETCGGHLELHDGRPGLAVDIVLPLADQPCASP